MDSTTAAERFRLRRGVSGYFLVPIDGATEHPLLLELFDGDSRAAKDLLPGDLPLVVGVLLNQATQRGLSLEPKGRLSDPVLHLTRQAASSVKPGVLQPFKGLTGRYAAHWGLMDLYPAHRDALEAALRASAPFDTGVFGAKKEIEYGRIQRLADSTVVVCARCGADDGVALADTAVWEAAGGNAAGTSGEDVLLRKGVAAETIEDVLRQLAEQAGVPEPNVAQHEVVLHSDAMLDAVLGAIEELTAQGDAELEARYARLVDAARHLLAQLL